jgi:hypothetical protein
MTTPTTPEPTQRELWERLQAALRQIAQHDRPWCESWLHGATLSLESIARAKLREAK